MKLTLWMQKAHREVVQLDVLAQIIAAYCRGGAGVGCLLAENYQLDLPEDGGETDPFAEVTFHCEQPAYHAQLYPIPPCPKEPAPKEQEAADVFCLGLLLYTMLTGKAADLERADMLLNMLEPEESLPFLTAGQASGTAWELLVQMTDLNAAKRPTMEQLLQKLAELHPGSCRIELVDKSTKDVKETQQVPLRQGWTAWTPRKSYSYHGRGYLPYDLKQLQAIPYRLCEKTYTYPIVSDCLPQPEKNPVQQIADRLCAAIDLGTWNSSVSYIDACGYAKDLCEDEDPIIPTAIGYLTADRCCYGREALKLQETHPEAVIRGFKRSIASGSGFTVTAKDGTVIEETYYGATVRFLRHLYQLCLHAFGKERMLHAQLVLTVPACYDPGMKTALCEALKEAAGSFMQPPKILTEPEAAGIFFGRNAKTGYAIVLDVGGGTSDVSLLSYEEGHADAAPKRMRSRKVDGIGQLGGVDFTSRIYEELLRTLRTRHGLYLEQLEASGLSEVQYALNCQRMRDAAEAMKILLTQEEEVMLEVTLFFPDRMEAENVPLKLKRRACETYIKKEVSQLKKCIQRLMTQQHLQPKDIQHLIITGGGSLVPYVRREAASLFEDTGCTLHYVDYSTVISRGAAIYANNSSLEKPVEQALSETNYDLGVQVMEGYGGRPQFRCLLPAGASFADGDLEAEPVYIFLTPDEAMLGFCQLVLYKRQAGFAHVEGSYAAEGDVIQTIGTLYAADFPAGFDPKKGRISFRIVLDAQECITAKVDFYSPEPQSAQKKLAALFNREEAAAERLLATQAAAFKPAAGKK